MDPVNPARIDARLHRLGAARPARPTGEVRIEPAHACVSQWLSHDRRKPLTSIDVSGPWDAVRDGQEDC